MDFQKVTAVATRRGIFQPAYDAYGGLAGFYDYGPVGVRMRRRILEVWRKHYVIGAGCLELDGALVGPEALFQASGHLGEFDDALVDFEEQLAELEEEDQLGQLHDGLNFAMQDVAALDADSACQRHTASPHVVSHNSSELVATVHM